MGWLPCSIAELSQSLPKSVIPPAPHNRISKPDSTEKLLNTLREETLGGQQIPDRQRPEHGGLVICFHALPPLKTEEHDPMRTIGNVVAPDYRRHNERGLAVVVACEVRSVADLVRMAEKLETGHAPEDSRAE